MGHAEFEVLAIQPSGGIQEAQKMWVFELGESSECEMLTVRLSIQRSQSSTGTALDQM